MADERQYKWQKGWHYDTEKVKNNYNGVFRILESWFFGIINFVN